MESRVANITSNWFIMVFYNWKRSCQTPQLVETPRQTPLKMRFETNEKIHNKGMLRYIEFSVLLNKATNKTRPICLRLSTLRVTPWPSGWCTMVPLRAFSKHANQFLWKFMELIYQYADYHRLPQKIDILASFIPTNVNTSNFYIFVSCLPIEFKIWL